MGMENAGGVTGLVLAGGDSRRFGANKALYPFDGQPMIAHVFESVSSVCQPVLIGVGTEPLPFEAVGTRQIRDEIPGAGPLAGIATAFHESATPWLLTVACDMPYLTEEALRSLLKVRSPSLQAVVATSGDGRNHPLCACYHRNILPIVESQLALAQRAMRDLLKKLDHVQTVLLPDGVLRNINTLIDIPPSG